MNVLAVFAHPQRDAFMGEVLDNFVAGAGAASLDVEVADLYRERFNPVMSEVDFAQFEDRRMPDDVLREQQRVERSDAIALIFPIWWFSFPAILKGWFDRVWCYGWAWGGTQDDPVSILSGRTWLVLCSAGLSEPTYEKYRYRSAFEHLVRVGTLSYCGVDTAQIRIFFEVDRDGDGDLKRRYLAEARELGRNLAVPCQADAS